MLISNIHETKTNLSKLIEMVLAGEDVIVAKAGKPVAKLIPYTPLKKTSAFGIWKGKAWISKGFDDEDKEINKMFYG